MIDAAASPDEFDQPDEWDDPDRGAGSLTSRDMLEVERFCNEAHAELVSAANDGFARRPGMTWRAAWSRANRPLPDDFGDEQPPVTVTLPMPPDPEPALPPVDAPRPTPEKEPPMPTQEEVIDALRAGPLTPEQIQKAVDDQGDGARGRVSQALVALKRRGMVKNDGRGTPWRLTTPGEAKQKAGDDFNAALGAASARSAKASRRPRPKPKAPRAAKSPRRAHGPKAGQPWGISDAFEIPAAPCRGGQHGPGVDALLQKRCDLIQAVATKVSAIDGAIRALIE